MICTCGGARSGYCAIGSVGMAITPARMITSEQTLARIGRLMKVSTNTGLSVRFEWENFECAVSVFGLFAGGRLRDRHAVGELLDAGHDHALTGRDPGKDHVVVTD